MSSRLSGRILLQVEEHGEAWYVNPVDLKRYYLGRPADAFQIMRELGLGITNVNLAKIPAQESTAQGDFRLRRRLSGRILLQVESRGEAWYVNPVDLKRYFLGRPADAFRVMRTLGLGITNRNLDLIPTPPVVVPPSLPPLPPLEPLLTGCLYNRPPCSPTYNCVDNQCVLKPGCVYGNPPCSADQDCINNYCILKRGCSYNNPSCQTNEQCVNNSCVASVTQPVVQTGCQFNNPACRAGEACVNNNCIDYDPPSQRSVDNALADLFGLSISSPTYPESPCLTPTQIEQQYPANFAHRLSLTVPLSQGPLPVTIGVPDESAEKIQIAQAGATIATKTLQFLDQKIATYPCNTFIIVGWLNVAVGVPGAVYIGGQNGINDWSLMGHEISHSYFHSAMSRSWFAEGAARTLADLNMWANRRTELQYRTYVEFKRTVVLQVENQVTGAGATLDTRLCEVENNYLNGSNLGYLLMQKYITMGGMTNYLSAMRTLYLKYRMTNSPITYDDLYRTYVYFAPSDKANEIRAWLAPRLCITQEARPAWKIKIDQLQFSNYARTIDAAGNLVLSSGRYKVVVPDSNAEDYGKFRLHQLKVCSDKIETALGMGPYRGSQIVDQTTIDATRQVSYCCGESPEYPLINLLSRSAFESLAFSENAYWKHASANFDSCLGGHEEVHRFVKGTVIDNYGWINEGLATLLEQQFRKDPGTTASPTLLECTSENFRAITPQGPIEVIPFRKIEELSREPLVYSYYTWACFWDYVQRTYGQNKFNEVIRRAYTFPQSDNPANFYQDVVVPVVGPGIWTFLERFGVTP